MSNNAVDDLRIYYKSLSRVQRALFPKALAEKLDDDNCSAFTIFKLSLRYSSLHSPGLYQFYRSPHYVGWKILEDNHLLTGEKEQVNFDAIPYNPSMREHIIPLINNLVLLNQAKLLTGEQGQANFDMLVSSDIYESSQKIKMLKKTGLLFHQLKQEYFATVMMKRHFDCLNTTRALKAANEAKLFSKDSGHAYRMAILQHYDGNSLQKIIQRLSLYGLLSGEQGRVNFEAVLNHLEGYMVWLRPPETDLKYGNIYLSKQNNTYQYTLLSPAGERITDNVSPDEIDLPINMYDRFQSDREGYGGYVSFVTDILKITLKRNHTITTLSTLDGAIGDAWFGHENDLTRLFAGSNGQTNFETVEKSIQPVFLIKSLWILNNHRMLTPNNRILAAHHNDLRSLERGFHILEEHELFSGASREENFKQLIKHATFLFKHDQSVWSFIPPHALTQIHFNELVRIANEHQETTDLSEEAIRAYLHELVPNLHQQPEQLAQPRLVDTEQSTHTASVHASVSESAKNLQARYGTLIEGENFKKQMKRLYRWGWWLTSIGRNIESMKVGAAKRCLVRLKNTGFHFTDPGSGITMQQLLVLCWLAINDKTVRTSTQQDAENSLIEGLYEIQRGYNISENGQDSGSRDSPICEGGAFNKLIQALAGLHPDFVIKFITQQGAGLKLSRLVIQHTRDYLSTLSTTMNPIVYEKLIQQAQDDAAIVLWPHVINKVGDDLFQEFESIFPSGRQSDVFQSVLDAGQYVDLSDLLSEFIPAQRIKNAEVSSVTPKQEDTLTNNVNPEPIYTFFDREKITPKIKPNNTVSPSNSIAWCMASLFFLIVGLSALNKEPKINGLIFLLAISLGAACVLSKRSEMNEILDVESNVTRTPRLH